MISEDSVREGLAEQVIQAELEQQATETVLETAGEAVQDNKREKLLRDLFGLTKPTGSGRSGTDAVLPVPPDQTVPFELKSATTDGITTARDVGPEHIRKWRGKHWLIGFFNSDGTELRRCLYASPKQMEPWISRTEAYIKPDFDLARLAARVAKTLYEEVLVTNFGDKEVYTLEDAKRLHKKQYSIDKYRELMDRDLPTETTGGTAKKRKPERGFSKDRMLEILAERWVYLTERGATLNNPHIRPVYYQDFKVLPINDPEEAQRALLEAVTEALRDVE